MISAISDFVDEEPSSFYRLVIGTDSQERRKNGSTEVDYVSAIIIHRTGKGARYFWKKVKKNGKKPVLRDKIYLETLMSLDIAQSIVPKIRKKISPAKYDLEIHIDVGPLGPTREMASRQKLSPSLGVLQRLPTNMRKIVQNANLKVQINFITLGIICVR
jgi:predicted RNase H-related nuclease YkuK (DUF458 family)